MASDQSFLLGEYGARLTALETSVGKIDTNVEYLVQRETVRDTKEKENKRFITTVSGVVAAIVALITTVLKEVVLK